MIKEFTCIVCPVGCKLKVEGDTITGNRCPRGYQYALQEMKDPKRVVTSTVAIASDRKRRLSVKTDRPIAKALVYEVINQLRTILITQEVEVGDVIVPHILGTDVNIVASDTYKE